MPNKLLVQEIDGTPKQMVFGDHGGDFSPTAANDLRKTTDGTQETDVQWASTGLANNAYRQSAKADLGENRAQEYAIRMAVEIAATPTAGNIIELYWAPSLSATAGTGNPANASGADAAYTGYSSNADNSIRQAILIGVCICTAQVTPTVQVAECGRFSPTERYGSLIVKNASGAAFHSDDVEIHVVFDPIIPEIQ